MYGLYLAGALCDKVTIFGFLRTWYNDTRYHYHNPYEPTGTQGSRDSAEMPLIESLVNKNPEIFSFGEPCVGSGAHLRRCVSCPPGGGGAFYHCITPNVELGSAMISGLKVPDFI